MAEFCERRVFDAPSPGLATSGAAWDQLYLTHLLTSEDRDVYELDQMDEDMVSR